MGEQAWRTIITESYDAITLRDEQMILSSDEKEARIPVAQIRELLLSSDRGSISLPLLASLAQNNTQVVFCNKKREPIGELAGINANALTAGRLMDQAEWKSRRKDAVWKQIVRQKITNQIALLDSLNIEVPKEMPEYAKNIIGADETNREAVAARCYFTRLYGPEFIRFDEDNVNAALNYGYTIIRGAFSRTISLHGYSTALGIHHCNRQNKFNFSCDLMEPFRPFVDRVVYANKDRELDFEYKKRFVELLHEPCIFDGKHMEIATAIDGFVVDTVTNMSEPRGKLKVVKID
jgi:CRISP-associated protein Cas1